MTEPLLCHRCTRWLLEPGECDARMNKKRLNEACFMFDAVSLEEFHRRAKLLGLARQESLFGSMKLETEVE